MAKIQSLKRLAEMGLNTPKILLEIPQFATLKHNIWADFYLHGGHHKVSIRTERDGEFICPHYPNIPLKDADRRVRELIHDGFAIYIMAPIDPSECHCRGNLAGPSDSDTFIFEFLDGPGTVRDLETSSNVIHEQFKTLNDLKRVDLQEIAQKVFAKLPTIRGKVIEWSYYRNPVGQLEENTIFWEIRQWQ